MKFKKTRKRVLRHSGDYNTSLLSFTSNRTRNYLIPLTLPLPFIHFVPQNHYYPMSNTDDSAIPIVIGIAVFIVIVITSTLVCLLPEWPKRKNGRRSVSTGLQFIPSTIDRFIINMEKEKPIRFTDQQLRIATDNYSYLLGSGGFGAVYKGRFSSGSMIAVKVLHGSSAAKRINQQFMAEVGTLGKIHHSNLVQLYGFCFERNLIALVYEYMGNGSLDKYLFQEHKILGFEKLHKIAVGTARGIAYLHEECQQIIIHYDIKPENILLDSNFNPKVADFGLAKLCNREKSHTTMTDQRGTPGYAAPELWMSFHATHKCDVYSFGMLLFEIIGRRRNHDIGLPESQQWFPMWVWKRFDAEQVEEVMVASGVEEQNKETAERMVKVALSCVQYRPESRPIMSVVVQMLEGSVEIPKPLNPFQHMIYGTFTALPVTESPTDTDAGNGSSSSLTVTQSSLESATSIMTKHEIKLASA